jgi:hypothetical protein
MKLEEIVEKYATPDPAMVSKLNKRFKDKNGNWQDLFLDYVGHADLTKILIAIDPEWNWKPLEVRDGAPVINITGGIATMWIELTVLGKTIIGVGSCKADKDDAAKELIGDALRNAAMRFGIAINLWSKADTPASAPRTIRQQPTSVVNNVVQHPAGKAGAGLVKLLEREAGKQGDPVKIVAGIIGRQLANLNDLTAQEARNALAGLKQETEEEPPF